MAKSWSNRGRRHREPEHGWLRPGRGRAAQTEAIERLRQKAALLSNADRRELAEGLLGSTVAVGQREVDPAAVDLFDIIRHYLGLRFTCYRVIKPGQGRRFSFILSPHDEDFQTDEVLQPYRDRANGDYASSLPGLVAQIEAAADALLRRGRVGD